MAEWTLIGIFPLSQKPQQFSFYKGHNSLCVGVVTNWDNHWEHTAFLKQYVEQLIVGTTHSHLSTNFHFPFKKKFNLIHIHYYLAFSFLISNIKLTWNLLLF